jgi:hypothetical protein
MAGGLQQMPDWHEEASRKLAGSKFTNSERDEVARELSGYLDDVSDESRSSGAGDSPADARAAHELDEDPRLGAHLYRARQEGNMNDRTRQFWLPAITTLFASFLAGWLVQFVLTHFSHQVVLRDENRGTAFIQVLMGQDPSLLAYFLWLYALLFIGAAGGYWSRRAGSARILQATVALFPLLLSFAISAGLDIAQWEGTMPARFLFVALQPWRSPLFYRGVGGGVLSWIIMLCAALVLGAAGVYWSRRAGGGRILQAAVALFPVLVFFAAFARMEVLQREGTRLAFNFPHGRIAFIFGGPGGGVLSLFVIPCAALLLGVLPFLLKPAPRAHEMNSAVSAQ